ncbi:MAG: amidohydrolase family protein [Gammaproteobacteria bacterium]
MANQSDGKFLQQRFIVIVAVCAALLGVLLLTLPTETPEPEATGTVGSTAYVNARVFDGRSVLQSATVVLADGKIVAMGADVELDSGVTRIDASGQTLLPGLIDAHTHTYGDALRNAVRFGVTTTLDMFTSPASLSDSRSRRDDTSNRQTDRFSAGMLATIDGGHGTQYGIPMETLSGPQDAEAFVTRRVAEGSDYIKIVYIPNQTRIPSLDLATCEALIDAAHDAGLLAVAHVSQAVAAQELLDAGVDGLVHIFADESVTDAFVQQASAAGLFVIPTLSVIASANATGEGARLAADPNVAEFLTEAQRNSLAADFGVNVPGMSLDVALDNVRRLHEAGVAILAGSDAPNPGTAQGASIHHEIELLTRAGLSPLEALTAATTGPAAHFPVGDRGSLKVGGRADLLVVNGNPFDDIASTRALAAIYRNGLRVERSPGTFAAVSDIPLGALSNFDEQLAAPTGFTWNATDDQSFGGQSVARIDHLPPDLTRPTGAMRVTTDVVAGFAYPWAGAYFGADSNAPHTVSELATLALRLRGTPAVYRVMFFNAGSTGAPPTVNVMATEQWSDVTIPLSSVDGLNNDALVGFAIVAGPDTGEFQFDIADVALRE